MICPRCWQSIPDDTAVCPSCGRASAAVGSRAATRTSPPAHEQDNTPTLPRARATAPISPATPATPTQPPTAPANDTETADTAADSADSAPLVIPVLTADTPAANGATAWASVPPLVTSDDDEIPFVMTAAPVSEPVLEPVSTATPANVPAEASAEPATPEAPAEPTIPEEPAAEPESKPESKPESEPDNKPDNEPASAPDGDGLPDYDTPDIERPAIHAPRPSLPDYETPDVELPAIHILKPPPDYDTPDEERPTVHPALEGAPASGHLAPFPLSAGAMDTFETIAANGAHDPYDTAPLAQEDVVANAADAATTAAGADIANDATPTYPAAYASPHAGYVNPPAASPASASPQAASDDPIERFFGVQPPPRTRAANNAIQRLWLRFLPPEWAIAPWISIPIGALVALVAGLLVSIIGLLLWGRAVAYLLDASAILGASGNLVQAVLAPNLLQLLLLEHGVPMSLALAPSATGSFSALETLPLTGLSLIPAAALILGGYVAAASDFTHHLRFSVLRGALVGPVYAILLLLVALFGSGDARIGQDTTVQLHPSLGMAFLAGLIWGALFGALGGLLAIRRHHLFTTNRHPDLLAGASWGALIAIGSGLLLALVALAAGVVAHAVGTAPAATAGQPGGGIGGALNAVLTGIALLIVVAPVAALWLFTLGAGANIESWLSASGLNVQSGTSSFGLLVAQHHPDSAVWWLLLLIPLASYLIGGRVAARIARASSLRDSALAGWLMAVILSLLLLVLTLLSRLLLTSEATVGARSITTSLGIAPAALAVFLLVLLFGGIVGAFGGASAALAPQPGPMIASAASPLLMRVESALSLARHPWDMFDAARGRRPPRTPLRALLYAAILAAALLIALFIVVALLGWIASHIAPAGAVRGVVGFFAGLAVGVPLLLLASAAIMAMLQTLPPLLTKRHAPPPVLPRYPGGPLACH